MAVVHRTTSQRELRNHVGEILGAAESWQTFTVTLRGRPVARLVPPGDRSQPRVDVDWATITGILNRELQTDLDAVEAPVSWACTASHDCAWPVDCA